MFRSYAGEHCSALVGGRFKSTITEVSGALCGAAAVLVSAALLLAPHGSNSTLVQDRGPVFPGSSLGSASAGVAPGISIPPSSISEVEPSKSSLSGRFGLCGSGVLVPVRCRLADKFQPIQKRA